MNTRLLIPLLLLPLYCGCICDEERFGRPNLFHPGHISEQRERMKQFDPYPQEGFGPTIEGGRPRGADMPRLEVDKIGEYYQRGNTNKTIQR